MIGVAAIVVGIAVSLQADPGQIAIGGLVQIIYHLALRLELAVVSAVVSADTGPVARCPLIADRAEQVLAIFVVRCQFGQVGAVFAETLGSTQFSAQQCGIERPVDGLDVGIVPLTVVVAQTLTTDFQDLAGVGRETAVADPEFTQCRVGLVGFALAGSATRGLRAAAVAVALLQRVGLNDVGGGDHLTHCVTAPVAALAIDPGTQVQAHTVDVAARTGAQIAIILGLRRGFDFDTEILWLFGQRCQRRAGPQQGEAKAHAGGHQGIQLHNASSPSFSSCRACNAIAF